MPFPKEHIPWNKGKTKETDPRVAAYGKKGGQALKGKRQSLESIKKRSAKLRGKKMPPRSDEWRINCSISMKEKWDNPEYAKHMSDAHLGQITWSKGLTKKTDERVAKAAKQHSKTTKGVPTGRDPWNKGLTKNDNEILSRHSDLMSQLPRTEEWNNAISIGLRNIMATETYRQKMSGIMKIRASKGEQHYRFNPNKHLDYPLSFNNELKTLIKLLDNNRCILCDHANKLIVHHINEIKADTFIWNLIALCKACHAKYHNTKNQQSKIQHRIDFYNYTAIRETQLYDTTNFDILDIEHCINKMD